MNLMVNQKPIIDTQKEKGIQNSTKDSHQITREEGKKKKGTKKNCINSQKTVTPMTVSTHGRYLLSFFLSLFICLFRPASMAYGISQTRSQIRAAAAGLHHSHSFAGSEPHLRHTAQHMAMLVLNPLSEARDRTHVLMDDSRVR